ncbi:MAG: hypothetical protein KAW12_20755 [Candidatus Aminicenantes bacterium]|nr:hypothetical protein [Candidatus Aminicenantes bacterium]
MDFEEKIKEPFKKQLQKQRSTLENTAAAFESFKPFLKEWPQRKKRIKESNTFYVAACEERLKKIAKPLKTKRYKKARRRVIKWGRFITYFHWRGLRERTKVVCLGALNIIRMALILSVYVGVVLLVSYAAVKLFNLVFGTNAA